MSEGPVITRAAASSSPSTVVLIRTLLTPGRLHTDGIDVECLNRRGARTKSRYLHEPRSGVRRSDRRATSLPT